MSVFYQQLSFTFQCSANPCFESSKCVNMKPGYRCLGCPPGFKGNAPSGIGLNNAQSAKQVCEDINECASRESNLCDPNSECINTLVGLL